MSCYTAICMWILEIEFHVDFHHQFRPKPNLFRSVFNISVDIEFISIWVSLKMLCTPQTDIICFEHYDQPTIFFSHHFQHFCALCCVIDPKLEAL